MVTDLSRNIVCVLAEHVLHFLDPSCPPLTIMWLFSVHTELMFLETSALTGENVEEGFLKCARTILNKIDSGIF